MKIDFPLPIDNSYHEFCPSCHSEKIHPVKDGEKTFYLCDDCQHTSPRLIVIDPKIVWWVDEETKEYWHESVGIFVFNSENKALFFERTLFPFVLTIPAGHLDIEETADTAAKRELFEETGIESDNFKLFSEENILGDKCRRGADNHKWHLYTTYTEDTDNIKISEEGLRPTWLTLGDALLKEELAYPSRYFISKYSNKLFSENTEAIFQSPS